MSTQIYNFDNFEGQAIESLSSTHLYSNHLSYDSNSSSFSQASPYRDTDSVSDKSKKIRKKRNTYQKIDDETRIKLIEAVQQGHTLKAAAKRLNVNYSSAKSILHTYRKEGRILKKSAPERTARRKEKALIDIEMSPIYLSSKCQEDLSNSQEVPTYQTYYSPTSQGTSDCSPFSGFNFVEDNSQVDQRFERYLKSDFQTQQEVKSPTSTFVMKLDPRNLQEGTKNLNGMQKGNWQIKVNINNASENTTEIPKRLENQVSSSHALKISEKLKSFESFCVNNPASPYSFGCRIKKEEYDFYNGFAPKDLDDSAEFLPSKSYDISCFLNPSREHDFPDKGYDIDYFGEDLTWMDSLRGVIEPQDFISTGLNKKSYFESMRPNLEEANTTNPHTSSLKNC